MLKIERVVAAALAGVVVSAAAAQDAVQWRVEDGGNGHWYATSAGVATWSASQRAAEAIGGYLATLTSEAENELVLNLVPRGSTAYLGGIQPESACEPGCNWQWVTGEAWRFTSWAIGEPNAASGVPGEDRLNLSGTGGWNDIDGIQLKGYVIEWSADCNGDGIVDYGQILDGMFADEDGNGVPDCCESACVGDLNGDDAVGPPDLGILLAVWGTDGGKIDGADINGDGNVNAADLGLLIGAWGECGGCN